MSSENIKEIFCVKERQDELTHKGNFTGCLSSVSRDLKRISAEIFRQMSENIIDA